MKITVTVDDYHIRSGFRDACQACPVKLAVDPKLPAFWKCKVHATEIAIGNARGSWVDLKLPNEVAQSIAIYDAGGQMQPFQFELWIPDAMFL